MLLSILFELLIWILLAIATLVALLFVRNPNAFLWWTPELWQDLTSGAPLQKHIDQPHSRSASGSANPASQARR